MTVICSPIRPVLFSPLREPTALCKGGGVVTPWSPSVLFTGSAPGLWYDPYDLAALFKDTAGTTPVTASDDLVARANDKSGNAKHWLQGTSGARAKFKTNGALCWFEFDGLDDGFSAASAGLTDSMDVMMGLVTTDTVAVLPHGNNPGHAPVMQSGSAVALSNGYFGTPSFHANGGAAISPYTRGALYTAWATGAGLVAELRNVAFASGLDPWLDFRFGNYSGYQYNGRLTTMIVAPSAAMAANRAEALSYVASKTS